jgi:hypothetical protein
MLNSLAPPKPSQMIAPPTADVSLLVVSRGPGRTTAARPADVASARR